MDSKWRNVTVEIVRNNVCWKNCGTKVTVVSEQLTNGKSNKLCTKYCHIIQKEISCQLCPREHG
jgi:hypothetical protein